MLKIPGKNKNNSIRKLIIIVVILFILLIAILYVKFGYEISSVTITGNDHYTEQEIKEIVFDKSYTYNSIFLYLKYHNKSIQNVPFIERIDVDIVNPNKVRINVYEKAVAGYVEYLGHYMYFDKDGIVVESSSRIIDGVPFVTGLNYDHVVLHDTLPVKNKKVFLLILSISQLLNKYEITTDRIAFDADENITLYFGNSRVSLGNDDYIDEKINEMHLLLPELAGYSGTLHMENYSGAESNFSFDKDEDLTEKSEDSEEENAEGDDGGEGGENAAENSASE